MTKLRLGQIIEKACLMCGDIKRSREMHSGLPPIEQCYTVQEVAERFHKSDDFVRNLFRDEPGVLKREHKETRFKRGYSAILIPESVLIRVVRRLQK